MPVTTGSRGLDPCVVDTSGRRSSWHLVWAPGLPPPLAFAHSLGLPTHYLFGAIPVGSSG